MNRKLASATGILVLAAIFVGVNIFSNAALRSAQIDFTEDRLYTLASGSKNIARAIDEPVTLELYYSARLAVGLPAIQSYARRVRELLEAYARVSEGMIVLRVIDPEPFSDLEDQAVQFGMQGVPIGDGSTRLYFGLVATNAVADREIIPFFDPAQDRFLELEISRLLYRLTNPDKPTLGILTTLEIGGVPADQQSGRPFTPAWQIALEVGALFEVRRLNPRAGRIPEDIDVLWVVHPKNFPPTALYAIDQFVLSGKPAFVVVDPHAEADLPADTTDNMARLSHETASVMPALLEAWGVRMNPEHVAADLVNAIEGTFPGQREPMKYIPWISLGPDHLDRDDPISGRLNRLNLGSAGVLDPVPGASTTMTRLAWTGAQSMRLDTLKARFLPDPKRLTSEFIPGDEELTVAAGVTGTATSSFPDGPPVGVEATPFAHIPRSIGPIRVVILADVDALTDRFWLAQTASGSRTMVADNGDFVINTLDSLAGSGDLLALRAGGSFARPFERVADLRARAEATYRSQQLNLESEIRQTQQRIDQIRSGRPTSALIVDPEVRAEIDSLSERLLTARKELRDVQLDLRRDVETLGFRLKLINTALAPAVIAVAAIGLGLSRAARRRADRRAMAHL